MFAAMVRDLMRQHEVVITCRPLANTIDLLDLQDFPYAVVGSHYGRRLSAKLAGYPIRVTQLWRFLRHQAIDVAVSQSSFYSPAVARLLGVRSLYLNDNEHALGNIPAFICANTIMVPEFFDERNLARQWAAPRKVIRYPGVKEGIYLWNLADAIEAKRSRALPAKRRPAIYVRPEPWVAQYYRGPCAFLDDLLIGLRDEADVTLLPRGQAQALHYQGSRFEGIRVIATALAIADIVPDCDLFIGAGGTMTREMAVMGVPTISVYQDELLDVDRYLLRANAFIHRPSLTTQEAMALLSSTSRHRPNGELLEKGRQAYELIKRVVLLGARDATDGFTDGGSSHASSRFDRIGQDGNLASCDH